MPQSYCFSLKLANVFYYFFNNVSSIYFRQGMYSSFQAFLFPSVIIAKDVDKTTLGKSCEIELHRADLWSKNAENSDDSVPRCVF